MLGVERERSHWLKGTAQGNLRVMEAFWLVLCCQYVTSYTCQTLRTAYHKNSTLLPANFKKSSSVSRNSRMECTLCQMKSNCITNVWGNFTEGDE